MILSLNFYFYDINPSSVKRYYFMSFSVAYDFKDVYSYDVKETQPVVKI